MKLCSKMLVNISSKKLHFEESKKKDNRFWLSFKYIK